MKTVCLRFIILVCAYFTISLPPALPFSDSFTHIATLKKRGRAPSIVFSPDGKLIAGGSNNVTGATIDLWRMNDLQHVYSIKGISRDVAFSPDGSLFITCMKNAVQLWDVETWRIVGILAEHAAEILSVTFSHDGQMLATGDWNGTIKLWDIATQRNITTINGHKHPDFDRSYSNVSSLDFSPDDKILASASWDNTVKLWNVDTGDEIRTLSHIGSVYAVAFSPDSRTIVSGASGGPQQKETLKVWEASTGNNIATFHGETVKSIDFSSSGDFLAIAEGQAVSVLDVATWTRFTTFQVHSPWFVTFSPDDNILVSSSWYGDIMIWDTSPLDLIPTNEASEEITLVAIPDSNLRAVIATAIGGFVKSAITVAKMQSISRIYGDNQNIRDLTGLESATNLTRLELASNSIFDVSPLTSLTNLTTLDLDNNFIADISTLQHLTSLTSLTLNGNLISDISALSELTELIGLYLYNNAIDNTGIAILSRLTELMYLNVASNFVSDISPLANLTQLRHLYLHSMSISDITPLSNLYHLTLLGLGGNSISDISPLANLTQLNRLYLNGMSISDISAISGLIHLKDLNLKGNDVEDLSPLVQNTGLGAGDKVDVRDNPLNRSSLLVHIPALIKRQVEVLFDDVNPPSAADVNSDGEINILDLVLVAEHIGDIGIGVVGDINNDGVVDVLDLVLIADAIENEP